MVSRSSWQVVGGRWAVGGGQWMVDGGPWSGAQQMVGRCSATWLVFGQYVVSVWLVRGR